MNGSFNCDLAVLGNVSVATLSLEKMWLLQVSNFGVTFVGSQFRNSKL